MNNCLPLNLRAHTFVAVNTWPSLKLCDWDRDIGVDLTLTIEMRISEAFGAGRIFASG